MNDQEKPMTPETAAEANVQLKRKIRGHQIAPEIIPPTPLASDEALAALRAKLSGLPDAIITIEGEVTVEGTEALLGMIKTENDGYREVCRLAAIRFLDECSLQTTPDAIDQLVDAFLPCLTVICGRGYDPQGANWRAMGWRGLLMEMHKRLNRMLYRSWKHSKHDANNAIDLVNYTGYYLRLQNKGPAFGDIMDPGNGYEVR